MRSARSLADECVRLALEEAQTDSDHHKFLEMAKTWMAVADRFENGSCFDNTPEREWLTSRLSEKPSKTSPTIV